MRLIQSAYITIIGVVLLCFSSCSNDLTNDTDIVVVNCGRLNRPKIAELINNINKNEPAIVGLDLILSNDSGSVDNELIDALANTKNLFKACYLMGPEGQFAEYESIDKTHSKFGSNGKDVIANIEVNSYRELMNIVINGVDKNTNQQYLTLGYEIFEHYTGKKPPLVTHTSQDGGITHTDHRFAISRADRFYNFPIIDPKDILNQTYNPKLIKDKIVLIGFTGEPHLEKTGSQEDLYLFEREEYFGVEIHAMFLNMLLHYQENTQNKN